MDPTRYDNVSLHKVTRVFGATRALAGVTLTFRAGEVASVEGPNGAGKSTLLGVLSTLSRPTAGSLCRHHSWRRAWEAEPSSTEAT